MAVETSARRTGAGPKAGPTLAVWAALLVALHAVVWAAGFRRVGLTVAVERGAAEVEGRAIGEVGDDVVRKAIQLQRDTLPFWTMLAGLGDFVLGPLGLAVRALAAATAFAGLAALTGRPVRFGAGLAGSAAVQGFWVLGLAVRVALMIVLRRADVETSPTLLLPPGAYPAAAWVALRQLDVFALIGWAALARGGWSRGQVNLLTASVVCLGLWATGAALAIGGTLTLEAGMRLTLIPEGLGK